MRRASLWFLSLVLLLGGCARAFNVRSYPSSELLYKEGLARMEREKWDDAIAAFEKLTLDLPARDTLLPRAHWYLGVSRLKTRERLLAAQSFIRLNEQFPEDTLADDALFKAAKAYTELWRKPELDPEYGIQAQTQFRLLLGLYPSSTLADSVTKELKRLDEWFANKDYTTGMHYIKRRAYDSAIIYFKDVVKNWPETDRARLAMLRLVEIYRLPTMGYTEDANEVCAALREGYPTDPEVLLLCKR